ncbi:hypothetical protein L3X38_003614 [Prunus dulcis]|uniref:Uncharacterized protein n=1 Tax=Prunus dulcis TaxID=3755 RepID=A0AAD4ZME3_PRUDU|nr:hypothetical protein L3X38_003614 [Prunus dulcis]
MHNLFHLDSIALKKFPPPRLKKRRFILGSALFHHHCPSVRLLKEVNEEQNGFSHGENCAQHMDLRLGVDLGKEKVKETLRSLIAPTIVRLSRPEEDENARKDLPNSNGGAGDNGSC